VEQAASDRATAPVAKTARIFRRDMIAFPL
jgi:hypothetical protein